MSTPPHPNDGLEKGEEDPLLSPNKNKNKKKKNNNNTEKGKRSSSFISSTDSSVRSITNFSKKIMQTLNSSQREHALKNLGIGPAARLMCNAVIGENDLPEDSWYDPYANPNQPYRNCISIVCGRFLTHRWMNRLLHAASWIFVLVVFISPPYWCRHYNTNTNGHGHGNDEEDSFSLAINATTTIIPRDEDMSSLDSCGILLQASGTARDGTPDVLYYPNSNSMWLTIQQSEKVEWTCLNIMTLFLLFELGRDGFDLQKFFFLLSRNTIRVTHCLRLTLLVVLYYGLYFQNDTILLILNPFLRLILLGTYPRVFQEELVTFLGMFREVCYILAILGVVLVFYGWFGVVLFYDTPQGKRDFSNLIEGCWTLWICVTTANYPDVMMPSYNENRLSGIFFVTFMIISFFFLMNIILASVVNAYNDSIQARIKSRKRIGKENLTRAFKLMDPNNMGRISRETIMSLILILNEDFPEIKSLTEEETKLVFGFLDNDGSSTITLEEFQEFGSILLLEFTKESDYNTFVQVHFPKLYSSAGYTRLCNTVRSATFEYIVDLILLLNAIVIGVQSYPELTGKNVELDPHYTNGYIDTVWEWFETIFTALYVVEVFLKVMVNGWKRYCESPRNRFDFGVTISALTATGYVYYPNAYSDSLLIRFIVMARVLRLSRLLMSIPAFQLIGKISAEIIPAATGVIALLFFLLYWFAAMGMILYGGMITRAPSNPLSYRILNTDFSDNNYWANNFNDMVSAINVLFNLLVVNNWTECEIGFEAVTGAKWVRLFFLSFHILGVILVNNLVVAVIINAFFQQMQTINKRRSAEEEIVPGQAVIRGSRAIFDASEITGTKTGASGGYIARLSTIHADVEVDETEGLRKLFTQKSSVDSI